MLPLSTTEYTISNTRTFVKQIIKKKVVVVSFNMVSFDVTSHFTNVPLDNTIEIILKRVYQKKEITTTPKHEMKELFYLCTKNVYFCFNNEIHIQNDGVANVSPMGSVLANAFMVELERTIIPSLSDKRKFGNVTLMT